MLTVRAFRIFTLSVGVDGPTCRCPHVWDAPTQGQTPRPQEQTGSPEATAV